VTEGSGRLRYYPLYLNIVNKRCTVVGGGEVAARKVERLLRCGARVTVIGRELSPALDALKKNGRVEHIESDYRKEHLEGAFLVIGATDNPEVNERIYWDSREKGVLVNIVDDPGLCDFILPSLMERGDLSIAVSTGGKSPALARKIRQELERIYGPEYEVLIRIMGVLRERVLYRRGPSEANRQVFEAVLDSDVLDEIRKKDWKAVKERVRDLTGEEIDDFEVEE